MTRLHKVTNHSNVVASELTAPQPSAAMWMKQAYCKCSVIGGNI